MTSIAQRVHSGLKVETLIKVGKTRYWKALRSGPSFKNCQMWDCLDVLHTDIVEVWNFRDPHKYLRSQEFRKLILDMVDGTQVGPIADPDKTVTTRFSMVGTVASVLAGPAAPIVVPIVAGVVFGAWVYDVYQTSDVVLQRFMAYIAHLALVLRTLFIVSESQELTRRAIKLAVKSYLASPMSGDVLNRIQEYIRQLTILDHADSDTLNKIEEVIQFYKIDAAEMSKLRVKHPVDLADEPW